MLLQLMDRFSSPTFPDLWRELENFRQYHLSQHVRLVTIFDKRTINLFWEQKKTQNLVSEIQRCQTTSNVYDHSLIAITWEILNTFLPQFFEKGTGMIEEKLRHHFASCSRLSNKHKKISKVIFCKGIWKTFARWIRNLGLWNPEYSSRNSDSKIHSLSPECSTWNPESTTWNPDSKTVLDSFTWVYTVNCSKYAQYFDSQILMPVQPSTRYFHYQEHFSSA